MSDSSINCSNGKQTYLMAAGRRVTLSHSWSKGPTWSHPPRTGNDLDFLFLGDGGGGWLDVSMD